MENNKHTEIINKNKTKTDWLLKKPKRCSMERERMQRKVNSCSLALIYHCTIQCIKTLWCTGAIYNAKYGIPIPLIYFALYRPPYDCSKAILFSAIIYPPLTNLYLLVPSRYKCDSDWPIWLQKQPKANVEASGGLQTGCPPHPEKQRGRCPPHLLLPRFLLHVYICFFNKNGTA